MTKQEFAEKLAAKTNISKAKAMEVIDCIFSTKPGKGIIAVELDAGRDFTITGFGTFKTRRTKARQGPQPSDGQGDHDRGAQQRLLPCRQGAEGPRSRLSLAF